VWIALDGSIDREARLTLRAPFRSPLHVPNPQGVRFPGLRRWLVALPDPPANTDLRCVWIALGPSAGTYPSMQASSTEERPDGFSSSF
jgi:hypothetical protein